MKLSIKVILLTMLMSTFGAKSYGYDVEAPNADGVTIYYDFIKNLKELAVTSSDNGSYYSGDIVIPASVIYKGKTYKVTMIQTEAFQNCTDLTSVTIPNSVTYISSSAFSFCSLTSITIPSSVTSIQGSTFASSSLISITIPSSVTSIGSGAFINCTNLTTITIPNSVTYIGNGAFDGCVNLASITLPSGLTSINDATFGHCRSLTSISIPSKVQSISSNAFVGCSSLSSITIPSKVTYIGDKAFAACSSLASITIPNSVKTIDKQAFECCTSLTSISIPNSVTYICDGTFSGCSGLTSFTIPNKVTSIGLGAFSGCTSLTSITIPSSVTSINGSAFKGCANLTSITIPNKVTSILDGTFEGCSSLTSITIPSKVTYIGQSAFTGCSGLTSITIPKSVSSIKTSIFSGCVSLSSISVESGNNTYDSRNNCNAIIEKKTKTLIAGCKNTTIPNTVTNIGSCAFDGCSGLTSIIIPGNVTSIDNNAFYNCKNLVTITSEISNPYDINDDVFYSIDKDIHGTAALIVPVGTKAAYQSTAGWDRFQYILEDGQGGIIGQAFESGGIYYRIGVDNTASVTSGDAKYTSDVIIPKEVAYNGTVYSVTKIEENAFMDCDGLTSITIPCSVTHLEACPFLDCTSLTDVYCLAEQVPEIEDYVYDSDFGNLTLHVLEGCAAVYKSVEPWSYFGTIVEMGLTPMGNQEKVDFGKDGHLNGTIDLSGTVIDKVYFNINPEDGDYDSEDNCVVVNKPMSVGETETVLTKKLFSDELKNSFAGMIIKLSAGKGKMTVEAQTSGDMTLNVKIGSAEPIRRACDEKQEMEFPFSVNVPTYVYIYAGETASVRNRTRTGAETCLRIYGISVSMDPFKMGDADGDGVISYSDVIAVLNRILVGVSGDNFVEAAADVNNDGQITITDALGILDIISKEQ